MGAFTNVKPFGTFFQFGALRFVDVSSSVDNGVVYGLSLLKPKMRCQYVYFCRASQFMIESHNSA